MSNGPGVWRAVLENQWKWSRGLALAGVATGFAIPLLSLRTAAAEEKIPMFIGVMSGWGIAYAIAAGALGLMSAIVAWGFDHRLRHVYALALPIARWRYVLLRYTAGAALLAIPVVAVLLGAEIVAHSSLVPPELNAYPIALTLRFAFALMVAYSLFFAISSGTPRTAGYCLGVIALIVVGHIVLGAANIRFNLVGKVLDLVLATPGLLAVFGGRWTLIDV